MKQQKFELNLILDTVHFTLPSLERFNSALAVIVPFVVFFIVLYSFLKYKDRYLRLSEKYDICDPIKDLINFLKSFIPVVVLAICLVIATTLRG